MDLVASLTLGLALVCAWQTPASEGRHGGGHLRLVRDALSPARCPISTHSWLVDLFFFFFKDYSLSTDLLHGSRGCEFLWTLDVVIEWAFA